MEETMVCHWCGRRGISVCKGCSLAIYCSVSCQRKHWIRHHSRCCEELCFIAIETLSKQLDSSLDVGAEREKINENKKLANTNESDAVKLLHIYEGLSDGAKRELLAMLMGWHPRTGAVSTLTRSGMKIDDLMGPIGDARRTIDDQFDFATIGNDKRVWLYTFGKAETVRLQIPPLDTGIMFIHADVRFLRPGIVAISRSGKLRVIAFDGSGKVIREAFHDQCEWVCAHAGKFFATFGHGFSGLSVRVFDGDRPFDSPRTWTTQQYKRTEDVRLEGFGNVFFINSATMPLHMLDPRGVLTCVPVKIKNETERMLDPSRLPVCHWRVMDETRKLLITSDGNAAYVASYDISDPSAPLVTVHSAIPSNSRYTTTDPNSTFATTRGYVARAMGGGFLWNDRLYFVKERPSEYGLLGSPADPIGLPWPLWSGESGLLMSNTEHTEIVWLKTSTNGNIERVTTTMPPKTPASYIFPVDAQRHLAGVVGKSTVFLVNTHTGKVVDSVNTTTGNVERMGAAKAYDRRDQPDSIQYLQSYRTLIYTCRWLSM